MPMEGLLARLAALEARVKTLEDHAAISALIASYGPAVDQGAGDQAAALWTEAGLYDWGSGQLAGRAALAALTALPTHAAYLEAGCAHVLSLPQITLTGDEARAVNYSRVYLKAGDHWRIERCAANLWHLVREGHGWRVAARFNRLLDGQAEARDLLGGGPPLGA